MCYRPLHITNRTLDFDPRYHKVSFDVPCGKCGECLNQKRNDWKVRCYWEYRRTKEMNGNTYFVTLTYNDLFVPVFEHNYKGQRKKSLCFRKKDVQLFNKRLRNRLKKYGYDLEYKYIFCSEFGGRFKRPHLHALLFMPNFNHTNRLHNYIYDSWVGYYTIKEGDSIASLCGKVHQSLNYISKLNPRVDFSKPLKVGYKLRLPLGRIDFGKPDASGVRSGIINGEAACKYVTKYIVKDIDFLREFDDVLSSEDEELIDTFKSCLPFHLQSSHLGTYALVKTPLDILEKGKIFCPNQNKKYEFVPIPLYLDRKMFYDVDTHLRPDSPAYVLNEKGLKMKLVRKELIKKSLIDTYNDIMNCQHDCDNALLSIINKCSHLYNFNAFSDFQKTLQNLLGCHSLDNVVEYLQVYKERVYDDSFSDCSCCFDCSGDFYNVVLSPPRHITNVRLTSQHEKLLYQRLFNSKPFFQNFDRFIQLIQSYKLASGFLRQKQFDYQRLVYSNLRKNY